MTATHKDSEASTLGNVSRELFCEYCRTWFEPDWSDEEADAEAEHYFGIKDSSKKPELMAVVCDDCWQLMHPDRYPELTQRAREALSNEDGSGVDESSDAQLANSNPSSKETKDGDI